MQYLAVLSHLRPRLAYILGHYGHARSQGGRQPAAAKPGLLYYIPSATFCSFHSIRALCAPSFLCEGIQSIVVEALIGLLTFFHNVALLVLLLAVEVCTYAQTGAVERAP